MFSGFFVLSLADRVFLRKEKSPAKARACYCSGSLLCAVPPTCLALGKSQDSFLSQTASSLQPTVHGSEIQGALLN